MRETTSFAKEYAAGLEQHQSGRLQQAEQSYRQILTAAPDHAQAWHGLGVIAYQVGQGDVALDYIGEALRFCPDFVEALNNRGAILMAQGRLEDALASYRRVLEIQADHAEAHHNYGNALVALGRHEEAEASHRRALRLRPDFAAAHAGLGKALCGRGAFDDAIPHFRDALQLQPDHAEAYHDLATSLKLLGRLDESLANFEEAVRRNPGFALSHVNRATVWLAKGDFERGWAEYEWRRRVADLAPRAFSQPLWDGASLAGKTILLHSEQGLGDSIQFIRYAPLVQKCGGRVVLLCPARMRRLFSQCPGIDFLTEDVADLPSIDVQAPLLSLPYLLKTTLVNLPADAPYFFAEPDLVELWRARLADIAGLRVGVCWQGNPKHPGDRQRSFPLAQLESLAAVPGVRLISLQRGHGVEQLTQIGFPVLEFEDEVDRQAGAFVDTAALMQNLDLVVTADTAVAHLAGALGVPVWLALSSVPDWRWLLNRDDSPWYPTARLFRQRRAGDWEPVFATMAEAMPQLATARAAQIDWATQTVD